MIACLQLGGESPYVTIVSAVGAVWVVGGPNPASVSQLDVLAGQSVSQSDVHAASGSARYVDLPPRKRPI